jgi:hypothetical protein
LGDALLVEHTASDSYWGDGGDGSGKNRLGHILMCVRDSCAPGGYGDLFGRDGKGRGREPPRRMRIFRGHKAPLRGVAYLPDGAALVSASRDGVIKVWDLASGQPRADFQLPPPDWAHLTELRCLAVSPAGAVAAGGPAVVLWDLATRSMISVSAPARITSECLAFTPDGKHLVAGMFWPVEGWRLGLGRRHRRRAFPRAAAARVANARQASHQRSVLLARRPSAGHEGQRPPVTFWAWNLTGDRLPERGAFD